MKELIGTLILLFCLWIAIGIGTLKWEMEVSDSAREKLKMKSFFKYLIIFSKSLLWGPFTKSKVVNRL